MEVIALISLFSFLHAACAVPPPTKCCPPNSELSYVGHEPVPANASRELVFRDELTCRPSSSGRTLAVPYSAPSAVGLPGGCRRLRLVPYRRTPVACVDRIAEFDSSIYGVACADSSASAGNWSIAGFRKCCPPHRKYDPEQQFCWSRLAADDANALPHLLKLAWRGRRPSFADVTFGAPQCGRDQALFDTLVAAADLEVVGDAVRLRSTGVLWSLDEHCVDLVDDRFEFVVVRACGDANVTCSDRPCVRKCCPDGQELRERECRPSTRPLSVRFYNETDVDVYVAVDGIRPALLGKPRCEAGVYPLMDDNPNHLHVITVAGQVVMRAANEVHAMDRFCVDNYDRQPDTTTMVCFDGWPGPYVETSLKVKVTTACAAVSAMLLFVTFLIYAVLPSLRNPHCRLITCYLLTSACSYAALVFTRVWPDWGEARELCTVTGYTMLFTFLSSFSWLNIISYDIWFTFRAVRSTFLKKSKTSKQFSLCCLYGWGLSAAWTIFTAYCQFMSEEDSPSSFWKPDIGDSSCWFAGHKSYSFYPVQKPEQVKMYVNYAASKIPFFIVPAALMIVFNIVLFIVTVKYCASIKAELQITHSNTYSLKRYTADMNEFMINVKLFILMGLNWTLELISLTVQPHNRTFFLFSDILNALGGTIIFCLFVLKHKVLRDMKKTFCVSNPNTGTIERATGCTASTTSSIMQSLVNSRRSVNGVP